MSRGQGRVYRPKVKRQDGRVEETKVWWLDYGVNGQQHRESSGTESKTEAFDLLRERVGHRKAGKIIGRPEKVTVHDLRVGLERHYEREGNRSLTRAKQGFAHLEGFLGVATPALKMTKRRIGEYFTHRMEEGAARGTMRYEIALLNTAYSVAVEDEQLAMRPMFKLPKASDRERDSSMMETSLLFWWSFLSISGR